MAIRNSDQWKRYKTRHDRNARADLIRQFMPLVHYVLRRMTLSLPATLDMDDMVAVGTLGLIAAVDRFDLGRGMEFTTFAVPRIRGAILDELRSTDWVPRKTRTAAKQFNALAGDRRRETGGLDLKRIAKAMRLPFHRVADLLKTTQPVSFISLSQNGSGDSDDPSSVMETIRDHQAADPAESVALKEMCKKLRWALDNLPANQRRVITQYYFFGAEQQALAKQTGVSRSRVSQIHTEALRNLRQTLDTNGVNRPAA